ncbi:polysaccharide pyruvyl transferase family protein [Microbacterium indicum]|uniref:polysaccharide pyruvyl transferase family protein n=1 Tax=Microbacterium indicum TaxID=358100 RepID=UPI00040F2668|nr:polysaccharide pyruvyl transferase family protein [Microbacterium indicum]
MPKKAMWITLGVRGNAGDALIYQTTKKLFEGLIDLDFRTVGEAKYVRFARSAPDNVIIGPGGILVRTNSARHVQKKLEAQWDRFEKSKMFIWSSGILQEPHDAELPIVRKILQKADRIVVRAGKEAELIREVEPTADPQLLPCSSLFTDRLLGTPKQKKDVVVVNFDAHLFTDENIADHPLRRFKAYAESEGLEVRSMVNAHGDSNRHSLDLFPLIEQDQALFHDFLMTEPDSKEFNAGFTERLQQVDDFGARYTGSRFAFGKRLHGWLPFLAFDQPAAFIGMTARQGMPSDYFGNGYFLAKVPRRQHMSRDRLDDMANSLVGKLNYFIHNEERLSAEIAERREVLWGDLQAESRSFAEALA